MPAHEAGEAIADMLTDNGLIPGSPEEEAAAAALAAEDEAPEGADDADEEPSQAEAERLAEHDGEDEPEQDQGANQDDEDADEAADEDADDDGHDDEDDAPADNRMVSVTVDGETFKVSVDEAAKGYMRQADYSRKTQAVASEREVVSQAAARAVEMLTELDSRMAAFREPDWNGLLQAGADREQVQLAYQQWQAHERQHAEVKQALAHANEHGRQQRIAASTQHLMHAIPEWQDARQRLADLEGIAHYARSLGFSDAEIAATLDSRTLLMARDAMRYRAIQADANDVRRRAVKKGARMLKAGSAESSSASQSRRNERSARQRLARSGSLADAAAVLMGMVE